MTADGFDPVSDVRAPMDVAGWSISRGWIVDREDLLAAHEAADELLYVVPQDGIVRDVVGQATIASMMHVDTRVLAAHRECDELRVLLTQVAEQAVDLLAARGAS